MRKQNNSVLWVIGQDVTAEKCAPIAKPLKYLEEVKVMKPLEQIKYLTQLLQEQCSNTYVIKGRETSNEDCVISSFSSSD